MISDFNRDIPTILVIFGITSFFLGIYNYNKSKKSRSYSTPYMKGVFCAERRYKYNTEILKVSHKHEIKVITENFRHLSSDKAWIEGYTDYVNNVLIRNKEL